MAGSSDFTIEIDERTYGDLRRELGEMPGAVDRAVVSAVNKTLSQGRTIIVDRLFALLNVKRGEIRKRVTVPHNGKATRDKPEGKIKIGKSRMGLINFGAKDTRTRKGKGAFGTAAAGRGVDVQVYRQGESANFPRAFIARYRGKATVLQRKQGTVLKPTGQKTSYGTDIKQRVQLDSLVGRFPIIPLVGPSPAEAFAKHPQIETEARAKIGSILREQCLSQIDRLLKRRKIDRPLAEAA
jgi:hypothetical protein